MLTIDELKEYLRVDADEVTLQTMLLSASSIFTNAGVKESLLDGDNLYLLNLGKMMLISHWYENRGMLQDNDKMVTNLPMGVRHIINTLKIRCKVAESKVTV